MINKKYKSPYPEKQITGEDFNQLVNYVNKVIENSDLSQSRIDHIDKKVKDFNNKISEETEFLQSKLTEKEETIDKIHSLDKRIDDFYSKIIEIFGVFIAVFTFIISGIQISFKAEGSFSEILLKSSAIFIPIIVCIIILLTCIKFIIRR